MVSADIHKVLEGTFSLLEKGRENFVYQIRSKEIGIVISVSEGVAMVAGLPYVGLEELLMFPGNLLGIAFDITENEIGVVLLGESNLLMVGAKVERTGRVLDIPVGNELIGRVINPTGEILDGRGKLNANERLPIERPSPAIMDRAPVSTPLQTGIKVIDALIPIGRGQRELILGDRQTGKTAIAIDTIINQCHQKVICIYCAIGQRSASVAKVIASLKKRGAMEYTIVLVTEGNDSPGLKYIAPYAATSIAEYFMENGKNVLIVYDDLTNHARAYRELSLLLRRPPGREAFPGDIFYIHSRLLERSTHLNDELGGGSLTALPIIETEAQNISDYIPTNLISITDGQIYLSPKLFESGILPAVDVGKSVSRVGGKAQLPAYRSVTANLKLAYSQFEELENYARFGMRMDDQTKKTIEHGKRIRFWLRQQEQKPMTVPEQIVVLIALTNGLFDHVLPEEMKKAEEELIHKSAGFPDELLKGLLEDKKIEEEDFQAILSKSKNVLSSFQKTPETA